MPSSMRLKGRGPNRLKPSLAPPTCHSVLPIIPPAWGMQTSPLPVWEEPGVCVCVCVCVYMHVCICM